MNGRNSEINAPIAALNSTKFGRLPVNPMFTKPNYFLILGNSKFFSYNCFGVAGMKFQFHVGNHKNS